MRKIPYERTTRCCSPRKTDATASQRYLHNPHFMKKLTLPAGLTSLFLLALTGCASIQPPTTPEAMPGGRPGYVMGYLKPEEIPSSLVWLPPPPIAGSTAFAADEAAYQATRKLRDTPRWAMAAKDADLNFPNAAQTFSCALDLPISQQTTPHLNALLSRLRADTALAGAKAKDAHKRQRPYRAHGDTSCTPQEKHKDDSYPSSHAAIGWAWALLLAELAPDRAEHVLARGLSFGESRIICGVHWKSDVEAGRLVGASAISAVHANPVFAAQVSLARQEVDAARRAGTKSPLDCQTESRTLAVPQ